MPDERWLLDCLPFRGLVQFRTLLNFARLILKTSEVLHEPHHNRRDGCRNHGQRHRQGLRYLWSAMLRILHQIGDVVSPDAVIATNTSSIFMTRLAAVLRRLERVRGTFLQAGDGHATAGTDSRPADLQPDPRRSGSLRQDSRRDTHQRR